jgi:hypothetical protein
MPRRNEKIKADQAYWIRQENGKGYSVYSAEQLKRLLENGTIKDTDRVQIRTAKGGY